jgi:hypothetical protein
LTQETYATIQEATKRQTRAVVRTARSMPDAEFARMNMAYTKATETLRLRKDEIHNTNEAILEDVETEDGDVEGVDELMEELLDGKDLEQLGATTSGGGEKGKGKMRVGPEKH